MKNIILAAIAVCAFVAMGNEKTQQANALIIKGKSYQLGTDGHEVDHGKAVELYRKAREIDCLDASFYLAHCYYEGLGVRQDKKAAIKYLEESAKAGKQWAKGDLANCYFFGDGVECDKRRAVEILMDEISSGSRLSWRSKMNLGLCHLYGLGIDRDIDRGAKIIDDAEKKGGDSCNRAWCAYLHYKGLGFPKDKALARQLLRHSTGFLLTRLSHDEREYYGLSQWFDTRPFADIEKPLNEMAADGCGEAMVNLALRYFCGSFVGKDNELAAKWLLASIDEENSGYSEVITTMFADKAFVAVLNKKVLAKDKRAMFLMAVVLLNGDDDHEAAVKLLEQASGQDYYPAYSFLGAYYLERKAWTNALPYLKKGLNKDAGWSAFALSRLYSNLEGKLSESRQYCELAAQRGYSAAQSEMGKTYYTDYIKTSSTNSAAFAYTWFSKAAAQGDVEALYYFGVMKYLGEGTVLDEKIGLNRIKAAADGGCELAKKFLIEESEFTSMNEKNGNKH